jgi:Flp pilus assembly protein TadD
MPRILLILLLALLPGLCGAAVRVPAASGDPLQAPLLEAPLWIPPELRQALQRDVVARSEPGQDRLDRLLAFMLDDDGLALRYLEQPTYDVAGSYRRRTVNCLSFTLMFVALAREAGLRAFPQASDDALSMRVVDDTLFRVTHMNAGVLVYDRALVVDVGSDLVVAGRSPRRIPDAAALALFHNNLAVEALLQGDTGTAAARIAQGLALDPDSATLWNNAGVIDWRAGRPDRAKVEYLRALRLKRDHVGALGNLLTLVASGHADAGDDVADVRERLEKAQRKDPFSQFVMAESKMDAGDLDAAIVHYRRAIRLLPDQPGFYRSLALAYARNGDPEASRRAEARADSLETATARRRMQMVRPSGQDARPEPGTAPHLNGAVPAA